MKILRTAVTRLIKIQLLFLCLFSSLIFIIGFKVPVGVPRLVLLVHLHCVIQILLLDRIAYTGGFDLFATASLGMFPVLT